MARRLGPAVSLAHGMRALAPTLAAAMAPNWATPSRDSCPNAQPRTLRQRRPPAICRVVRWEQAGGLRRAAARPQRRQRLLRRRAGAARRACDRGRSSQAPGCKVWRRGRPAGGAATGQHCAGINAGRHVGLAGAAGPSHVNETVCGRARRQRGGRLGVWLGGIKRAGCRAAPGGAPAPRDQAGRGRACSGRRWGRQGACVALPTAAAQHAKRGLQSIQAEAGTLAPPGSPTASTPPTAAPIAGPMLEPPESPSGGGGDGVPVVVPPVLPPGGGGDAGLGEGTVAGVGLGLGLGEGEGEGGGGEGLRREGDGAGGENWQPGG